MCDQADIGYAWPIAAAEAAGAWVTRQHGLDRAAAGLEPMPEPLRSGRRIEVKLLGEVFSHARDDEGMGIHGNHLGKRSHVRPCVQIPRHERGRSSTAERRLTRVKMEVRPLPSAPFA